MQLCYSKETASLCEHAGIGGLETGIFLRFFISPVRM